MKRFIEESDRTQGFLLPESIDEYVSADNPVRVIEAFVEELDLGALGFDRVQPEATGRPGYHPSTLLKIYLYGYLNRIQSSRRLERETQSNLELMWLTGRLAPDFKTIADFRKDSGEAIRGVCREFISLCRQLELFSQSIVAIDGSKFKAVNNRDRNFTVTKMKGRLEQTLGTRGRRGTRRRALRPSCFRPLGAGRIRGWCEPIRTLPRSTCWTMQTRSDCRARCYPRVQIRPQWRFLRIRELRKT